MTPATFPEANLHLTPPQVMQENATCDAIVAYTDGKVIISAWDLSDEEIADIIKTRRVWLWVWGNRAPPVALETRHPFGQPR